MCGGWEAENVVAKRLRRPAPITMTAGFASWARSWRRWLVLIAVAGQAVGQRVTPSNETDGQQGDEQSQLYLRIEVQMMRVPPAPIAPLTADAGLDKPQPELRVSESLPAGVGDGSTWGKGVADARGRAVGSSHHGRVGLGPSRYDRQPHQCHHRPH